MPVKRKATLGQQARLYFSVFVGLIAFISRLRHIPPKSAPHVLHASRQGAIPPQGQVDPSEALAICGFAAPGLKGVKAAPPPTPCVTATLGAWRRECSITKGKKGCRIPCVER